MNSWADIAAQLLKQLHQVRGLFDQMVAPLPKAPVIVDGCAP